MAPGKPTHWTTSYLEPQRDYAPFMADIQRQRWLRGRENYMSGTEVSKLVHLTDGLQIWSNFGRMLFLVSPTAHKGVGGN